MMDRLPLFTTTEHGENCKEKLQAGEMTFARFREEQESYYDRDNIRADMRKDC